MGKGSNVNMRSQPNTKARIIASINENQPSEFPTYTGEWTAPKGDKWILAEYYDENAKNYASAWISAKYADIITGEEYAIISDRFVDDEEFAPQLTQKKRTITPQEIYLLSAHSVQEDNRHRINHQRQTRRIKRELPVINGCALSAEEIPAGNMPKPGNSCSKNPFGKKFHKWVMTR